jgi:hypothetical protein
MPCFSRSFKFFRQFFFLRFIVESYFYIVFYRGVNEYHKISLYGTKFLTFRSEVIYWNQAAFISPESFL